jgi:hypothetical protein
MMTVAAFNSIAEEAAGRVNCAASDKLAEMTRQTEVLAGIGSVLAHLYTAIQAIAATLDEGVPR